MKVEYFFKIIGLLFVNYMLIHTTFLLATVSVGALRLQKLRILKKFRNMIQHPYYFPVTIVIPAYNEELVIVDTVKNLLHQKYKLFEIIIVNDGSSDKTSEVLLEAFRFQKISRPIRKKLDCKKEKDIYYCEENGIKITLVNKENGGKSDALNMGINLSSYPYYVTLDADSLLDKNALEYLMRPILEDSNTVAVGGFIGVSQSAKMSAGEIIKFKFPRNIFASLQVAEYDRSFLASRIFYDLFNGNLIISGAFGLYHKETIIKVGGYRTNIVGEDMELVMRIHSFMLNNNRRYKLKYQPDAICYSQTPESIRDLVEQKRRWHIGLFQSLILYPEMISRFKDKPIIFVSFFSYIFFELLGPFIEVFGIITIIIAYFFDILNVPFMINLFLIYVTFGILSSFTIFMQRTSSQNIKLSKLEILKGLFYITIDNALYRYFLSIVRVHSLFGYKKYKKRWESITRKKHDL